ncbi:MAG: ExeM/NucH family extracellular endonuclease, partial [Bacteroidota bacterium]
DILDNNTAAQHGSTVPFGTYIIGSPTPAVTVRSNATPAEPSTNGSFQLTLNETPASDVTVTYSLTGTAQENTDYTDASAGSVVISSGTTTADVVINIIDDNEEDANETIIITLQSANNGYATNNASATLTITDDETTAFVPIYTIQGSGTASPLVNQNVTTRGVVTATYFGTEQMGGFFIQDATGDGDTNTSDGIYVFCNSNDCQNLSVGDEITMDATVQEFFDATQLSNVSNVSVLSSRLMLPPPTIVTFDGSPINFEALEGMLVQYAGRLYVSDVFEAGRFGDITLSPNAPLTQPTQVIDPNDATASGTTTTGNSNAAAIATQTTLNANNQMVLSDGQTAENPTNLPFFFSTEGTVRIGSSVNELTGIIHYSFSEYRLEPLDDTHPLQSQTFDHVARPAVPNLSNADVVISAFNVLNYFNGDGQGGGFPTSRGASTFSEFQRQEAKIVAALNAMNADIVGLNELENDGTGSTSAIQQLVDALNAVAGANTYAFVDDSSVPHTSDQIRNGIIYQPARVTPIGTPFTSSGTVYSRKPVAQRFRINADNTEIIYIINHFKSKGCVGAAGADADQNDGQACYNDRRRNQALDLMSFINSLGADEKIIAMGDYNSYFEEDPVDVLRAGGMQVLNQSEDVSFVFFGQGGTLDFAFANDNFNSLVSDFESWNINAEEPRALDYNDFNQAALYKADPFRSSDHNPVLIGMRSSSSLPISWVEFEAVATHKTTALSWTTDGQ